MNHWDAKGRKHYYRKSNDSAFTPNCLRLFETAVFTQETMVTF